MDPCLFQCIDDGGLSILVMFIDDLQIIGKPETNENTINDLKQYIDIKNPQCWMIISVTRAWLGQRMIIDALTKKYGKEVENQ